MHGYDQLQLLVLVQVQVMVLDFSGPTSLRFGLKKFFGLDSVHVLAFALSFLFILYKLHITSLHTSHQPQKKQSN